MTADAMEGKDTAPSAVLDETVLATAELVDRVMAEDDANDPNLAEYQRLYGEGHQ